MSWGTVGVSKVGSTPPRAEPVSKTKPESIPRIPMVRFLLVVSRYRFGEWHRHTDANTAPVDSHRETRGASAVTG